ncbi:unnamed protein product [Albugo candida]|uniref:Uncharacterized protein n=1 Tax=Albugo candida TaxID=65357 RepID=A0A024G438_9STRA|nr:unnamed protein product [Albugo candida]|eukprot:CCI41401.1 unnamed protein product [Albugo candida]
MGFDDFKTPKNDTYDKLVSPSEVILDGDHQGPEKKKKTRVASYALIIVGVLLAITGIIYGTAVPAIVNRSIKNKVFYCDSGDVDEAFIDPYGDCDDCNPYYRAYHVFNVTNTGAFLNQNEKLNVQERGPYVYRQWEKKVNVTFAGDRVQYKKYFNFAFDPAQSCSNCRENDTITSFDAGYFSVIAQAGGEFRFLVALLQSIPFGANQSLTELATSVTLYGPRMMRFLNGLNSLDPAAMALVATNLPRFLLGGPSALANLDLSGFAYNGILVTHSIREWSMGYPSFLAGLALGTQHLACQRRQLTNQCDACAVDGRNPACSAISNACKLCKRAAAVVSVYNNPLCDQVESIYAGTYGAAAASNFTASTCRRCASSGFCVAPLSGAVEESGVDWSRLTSSSSPPPQLLKRYTQRTGCDDATYLGEYEEFDGYTSFPLWADLGSRRNPTLQEIVAFGSYSNCAMRPSNLTCANVTGGDGKGVQPQLTTLAGPRDSIPSNTYAMYTTQSKQNVTLMNTRDLRKESGIELIRFAPNDTLLHYTPGNNGKGTGVPVNGVQNLAFALGFLCYVSYPMFMYGDQKLLEDVQITLIDGKVATKASLYADGKVKKVYADKYENYLDIEPTTGKTLVARKRLMASFALSKSVTNSSASMSDLVWPSLTTEVIYPVYWVEERASIKEAKVGSFKSLKRLGVSFLPVFLVGLIFGLFLVFIGVVYHRRA